MWGQFLSVNILDRLASACTFFSNWLWFTRNWTEWSPLHVSNTAHDFVGGKGLFLWTLFCGHRLLLSVLQCHSVCPKAHQMGIGHLYMSCLVAPHLSDNQHCRRKSLQVGKIIQYSPSMPANTGNTESSRQTGESFHLSSYVIEFDLWHIVLHRFVIPGNQGQRQVVFSFRPLFRCEAVFQEPVVTEQTDVIVVPRYLDLSVICYLRTNPIKNRMNTRWPNTNDHIRYLWKELAFNCHSKSCSAPSLVWCFCALQWTSLQKPSRKGTSGSTLHEHALWIRTAHHPISLDLSRKRGNPQEVSFPSCSSRDVCSLSSTFHAQKAWLV